MRANNSVIYAPALSYKRALRPLALALSAFTLFYCISNTLQHPSTPTKTSIAAQPTPPDEQITKPVLHSASEGGRREERPGTAPTSDIKSAAAARLVEAYVRELTDIVTKRQSETRKLIFDAVSDKGKQTFVVEFSVLSPLELSKYLTSVQKKLETDVTLSESERESILKTVGKSGYFLSDPTYPNHYLLVELKPDQAPVGRLIESVMPNRFLEIGNGELMVNEANTRIMELQADQLRKSYSHLANIVD